MKIKWPKCVPLKAIQLTSENQMLETGKRQNWDTKNIPKDPFFGHIFGILYVPKPNPSQVHFIKKFNDPKFPKGHSLVHSDFGHMGLYSAEI